MNHPTPGRRLRAAAAVVCGAAALTLAAVPTAAADPLPGGLGPCIPGVGGCPDVFPYPPNNGPITHHDNQINVFTGGDYLVRGGAAEVEGKVVVLGDYDQNKRSISGGLYNIGVVGVGSRVPPDDGTDFLTVGGDVTFGADTQRYATEAAGSSGRSRVAGTVNIPANATPAAVHDPDATAPYRALRQELADASHCYAYDEPAHKRPATGTVSASPGGTILRGDGTSAIQVFDVEGDISSDVSFEGIPAGATVLVNVYGATPTITTNNVATTPNELGSRLMWNFPDATTVALAGTSQFQGSILGGNTAGMLHIQVPGTNGRIYTSGSLTHESRSADAGGGEELHAYPFDGDLPGCGTPSPSPSPTPSPTPTPTPTPSPSHTPTPTPSTSSPVPSHTPTPGPHPSSSRPAGPALAKTGSNAAVYLTLAGVLLAAGAAATVIARRTTRSRRH